MCVCVSVSVCVCVCVCVYVYIRMCTKLTVSHTEKLRAQRAASVSNIFKGRAKRVKNTSHGIGVYLVDSKSLLRAQRAESITCSIYRVRAQRVVRTICMCIKLTVCHNYERSELYVVYVEDERSEL